MKDHSTGELDRRYRAEQNMWTYGPAHYKEKSFEAPTVCRNFFVTNVTTLTIAFVLCKKISPSTQFKFGRIGLKWKLNRIKWAAYINPDLFPIDNI